MSGVAVTREAIEAGLMERITAGADPDLVPLSEEERRQSLEAILAGHPEGSDVWVFAYGSLIWNPAMEIVERRRVTVFGFHRGMYLLTRVARGTPDRPGLLLGLDQGGSCVGLALRIPAAATVTELTLLWRREMVDTAYRPVWVKARCGNGPAFRCLAFVMNRGHRRYMPRLPDHRAAAIIGSAHGQLGSCADYLRKAVAGFAAENIVDQTLIRIAGLVDRAGDPPGFAEGGEP